MRNEPDQQVIARIERLLDSFYPQRCDETIAALLAIGQEIGVQAGEELIDRNPQLRGTDGGQRKPARCAKA